MASKPHKRALRPPAAPAAEAPSSKQTTTNGHFAAAALEGAEPHDAFTNALDPLGLGKTFGDVWSKMLADPVHIIDAQTQMMTAGFELWHQTLNRLAGLPSVAVATAEPGDRRFSNEAWSTSAIFDFVKQAYLIASQAMLKNLDDTEGIDPKTKKRARFFTRQFINKMSPSNFALFNPEVIEETVKTGGKNLVCGMQNMVEDLQENNGLPALVDKKAFKVGENVATTPGKVVYRNELVELIQYTPTTPQVYARPLMIVPPWINKYYILDLKPENSFIKYAVSQGVTTFVLSWRNPGTELAATTMDDYVEKGPIACATAINEICGTDEVNAIGYCIGGTLLSMTMAYLKRKGQKLVNAATFFTALIDFTDVGEIDAFINEESLTYLDEKMRERGYLDGSEMATTFNMLRSNDLIWSVAVNRWLMGKEAPAFDLLFWNGDSTRLPYAMHSYYLREMYVNNNLMKPDALKVRDVPIDLRLVDNDVYTIATAEDHIAPWRTVYKMTQVFSGATQFRLGHSGHIAGIVNPPAKKKGNYWKNDQNPADPQKWLDSATRVEGSWWPDWSTWIAERSGEEVAARIPGETDKYPALADAPGTYIFEK